MAKYEKGEKTRAKLLEAAGTLVQRHGYRGAGLNQVIAESGAPRGSLYFHFPGGKDELVAEALAASADRWKGALEETLDAAPSLEAGLRAVCAELADQLEGSGYRLGCPLATATLEAASDNDRIQRVSAEHYASWERAIGRRLEALDPPHPDPARLARFALASIEGALLLARAYRDPAPLHEAADLLARLLAR